MRYIVRGAKRDSGEKGFVAIDADSPTEAERFATSKGMIVTEVVPESDRNPVAEIHPLIDKLRREYVSALHAIDSEVGDLIATGKEMRAITLLGSKLTQISEIHDILSSLYATVFANRPVLHKFRSKRLNQLGHELKPIMRVHEENGGDNKELFEGIVLQGLRDLGIRRQHWLLNPLILAEIDYLLETLAILVEPDFQPVEENQNEQGNVGDSVDRHISTSVKISVWRRDQGRCVVCKSNEKLEYDHIIPVSKGGSNTERNIQLLCEKCNRNKGSEIV